MFYCEPCGLKNDWPVWMIFGMSVGPCECCGKTRECFDVPSHALPAVEVVKPVKKRAKRVKKVKRK